MGRLVAWWDDGRADRHDDLVGRHCGQKCTQYVVVVWCFVVLYYAVLRFVATDSVNPSTE